METHISIELKEAVRQAAQGLSPETTHIDLADPFQDFSLVIKKDHGDGGDMIFFSFNGRDIGREDIPIIQLMLRGLAHSGK